jgi:hypothetical protein
MLEDLKNVVIKATREHPEKSEHILDLYQLCLDEIDNGESVANEVELCFSSIKEITD